MDYKFYRNSEETISPINKDYIFIKSQFHLYDLLTNIWSIETCAPRLREEWSKENPSVGQCSITAFLAQDIFGGEVYGVPLPDGNFHCFNVVGELTLDLTSEQFLDEKLRYDKKFIQNRENHLAKKEKFDRYILLKNKLKNL